jgi:hypothetical protein
MAGQRIGYVRVSTMQDMVGGALAYEQRRLAEIVHDQKPHRPPRITAYAATVNWPTASVIW